MRHLQTVIPFVSGCEIVLQLPLARTAYISCEQRIETTVAQ